MIKNNKLYFGKVDLIHLIWIFYDERIIGLPIMAKLNVNCFVRLIENCIKKQSNVCLTRTGNSIIYQILASFVI